MSKSKLSSALTIAAVTFAGMTQSADADPQDFVYPHTDCRSLGTISYADADITATGAGTTTIYCSITRDFPNRTTGLADLEISVFDPGAGTIDCTVVATDLDGDSWDSAADSSSGSAVDDVLDFGAALNSSFDLGTFFITCTVPQNGQIHGYKVVE